MERLYLSPFKGRIPRLSDKLLGREYATVAKNTDLRSGEIKPFKALNQLSTFSGVAQSARPISSEIFQSTIAGCNFVYHDISGVRSLIVSDGTAYPKQYTDALYPSDHRRLGVVAPTDVLTMTFSTIGAVSSTEVNKEVSYTYTYVTSWGEESAPAPATASVSVQDNQYITLTNFTSPSAGNKNDVTAIRIYRLETGSQGAEYQFLEEVDDATTSYEDYNTNVGLNPVADDVLPSENWDQPPNALSGILRYANGVLAGFSGNTLYLSEPFIVYAWPDEYTIDFDSNIVGIAAFNDSIIVMTQTKPYIVQGTSPENMIVVPINIDQKCLSKASIVESQIGVFYASPDGLMLIDGSSVVNVTKGIITKEQWNSYTLSSLIGFWYDDMYIGFFKDTAVGFMLVNDSWVDLDLGTGTVEGGYVNLSNDELYLIMYRDPTYYLESFNDHATNYLAWEWKSGIFDFSFPSNFSCMAIKGVLTGNVTTTVYGDGSSISAQNVADQAMKRLPCLSKYYDFQVNIASATGTTARSVENICFATTPQSLRMN